MRSDAKPHLPPRPFRVPLGPEEPPLGFVAQELPELGRWAGELRGNLADVLAWPSRPDPSRGLTLTHRTPVRYVGAFPERTAALPEVSPALERLYGLVSDDPQPDQGPRIAHACLHLALWAEERGALRTAVAFAQAASDASPEDPDAACTLGRLARAAGEHAAGMRWLRWARVAAHRLGDRAAFARASSLAALAHYERGERKRAAGRLLAAGQAAACAKESELEGDTLSALAMLCFEEHRISAGAAHAMVAACAYGRRSPRLRDFAADLVWLWTSQGYYHPALRLAADLAPRTQDPERRALLYALQARAAACLLQCAVFERAWNLALEALGAAPQAQSRSFVLLQLARAAHTVGGTMGTLRAITAATMAHEAAHRARKAGWAEEAQTMLVVLTGPPLRDDGRASVSFPDGKYTPPALMRISVCSLTKTLEEVVSVLLSLLAPEERPAVSRLLRSVVAAGGEQ